MTPHAFIAKWRDATLKERSAAQEHFLDLCRLLDEPTPAEADPTGATYCFERGARKDTGGDGWADVWKRHCFAWEYKGQRANLDAAFAQLRQYALALENPPLLIVSDLRRFRIRTNWTNSVSRTYEFDLDDLTDRAVRDRLKWAFSDPERLRPGETRRALTERAAAAFAAVAQTLRARGLDPPVVAHFVNRLVFCMFADDVGLLPDHMFTRMLRQAQRTPEQFTELAAELFRVMAAGGRVGFEAVAWFNGGLFDDGTALPLEAADIETVLAASDLDWSEIDPSAAGKATRAGRVATNSIRGGANRRALQAAIDTRRIVEAWSDEPWVIDGAAVRVSLVCFSRINDDSVSDARLDGQPVDEIYADLTARRGGAGVDLTVVRRLSENANVAFMGDTKGGPFDVAGDQGRAWLRLPANPNGRTNADVLKPWVNGMDLTRRPAGKWIVDFGWTMSDGDAALYEEPFRWVKERVYPMRQKNRIEAHRLDWWRHLRPRPEMWRALDGLSRYIATPRVAKYRLFVWLDARVCPDSATIAITRDDDVTFGILHSRFHEAWSLRLCTWLGKGNDPRYTPTTTFETFPFPDGLTPNTPAADYADDPRAAAIADAAQRLVELRDRWLNPPEWVEWLDEPVPGYPTRPVPRDETAVTALKTRTLTNLYNARPTWLADAHAALDAAVATAYGWPADISNDDALAELLALNLANGR